MSSLPGYVVIKLNAYGTYLVMEPITPLCTVEHSPKVRKGANDPLEMPEPGYTFQSRHFASITSGAYIRCEIRAYAQDGIL